MSSDGTELTFVRCWSCRSLVPAMSAQCRMCGAPLDQDQQDGSKPGKDDDSQAAREGTNGSTSAGSPEKVQQRSHSEPTTMLSREAEHLRAGKELPEEEDVQEEYKAKEDFSDGSEDRASEERANASASGEDESLDPVDPLGAFITEVEQETAGEAEEPEESQEAEADEESSDEASAQKSVKPEPSTEQRDASQGHQAVQDEPAPREQPKDKPAQSNQGAERREARQQSPQDRQSKGGENPKVVVERGKSNGSKRLNFGGERGQKRDDRESRNRQHEQRRDERREEREARHSRHERSEKREERSRNDSREDRRSQQRGPSSSEQKNGRLYGWLVSYADPDGEAQELREGSFFFTQSELKRGDFVVDHDSVSTPHALIQVGGKKQFSVQDLMSDHGVYRRRGDGSFEKMEEAFIVEHGDWLRFGEVEYLVSLVAHVGKA